MSKKNKTVFLIWEHPSSHQVIHPIVKKFSKFSKVYIISQKNDLIENLNIKDSNYIRFASNKKISYFKGYNLVNNLILIYFLIYSFFSILILKPNYVYIFNKYPLLVGYLAKKILKIKIIYHNLDYNPNPKKKFQALLKKIEKISASVADIIIFSHQKRGNRFLKDTKIKKKIITVYNSLSLNFFKKYNNKIKNENIKKIFYFGSIGPGHGIISLIKSLKFLNQKYKLYIFGWVVDKKYYLEINRIIKKLDLRERIIIKINVKDYKWKNAMKSSDLGVALYDNSNFSHKYMFPASQKINAFLSAGLPILISKSKDMDEFNLKYNCCIKVDFNPKNIAANIKYIFNNKILYKKLKKNSLKAFKKVFNFEYQFKVVEKLL